MKKHEKILKSYRRNHGEANYSEAEQGKIKRETAQVRKMKKQAKLLTRQSFQTLDDRALADEYDELVYKAKKVSGNLSTHKSRLKELEKNSE